MLRVLKFLLLILLLGIGGLTAYVYAFPEKAAQGAVQSERERSKLVLKEVTLVDGLKYVYLEGGEGEPLLLLHGFGANKDNFTRVARHLVPQYRVIIPDHIGFGQSSHPQDADYAPAAQAARLRGFVQALNLGKIHIGGSSMGGQIAANYAVAHPDEVGSLWLIGAAGMWSAPPSELTQAMAGGGRNPLMATNEDEYAEIFKFVMSKPPFIPRPILDVFAQERISNHALEQRIFEQIRGDKGLEQRIAGLQTPALVVTGDQDRAIHPASAEIFHKLLSNSQLIVMPGIGHLPMLEDIDGSARDYLAFRATLKPVAP